MSKREQLDGPLAVTSVCSVRRQSSGHPSAGASDSNMVRDDGANAVARAEFFLMLSQLRILLCCCGALCLSGCSSSAQRAEQIGCARHQNPRTAQICRTIAEEMEFKWMGHAAPAPGYKVTTQTLVHVYCRLGLTKSDAPALKLLTGVGPASDNLLKLVGATWVDPGNSLSPENPSYVLKGGCPAD